MITRFGGRAFLGGGYATPRNRCSLRPEVRGGIRPAVVEVGPAESAEDPRCPGAMQMEQASIPRWQMVTGRVLSGALAFVFLPSAFFKVAQPAGFLDEWTK